MKTDDAVLVIWTVYKHPRDYPDKFVARAHIVGRCKDQSGPTTAVVIADTLDAVRAQLPPGLIRMPRLRDDDPVIVETWL